MRTRMLLAVLLTAALAGCEALSTRYAPPPSNRPQVSVVGDWVVVSPEPLTFRSGAGPVQIVWQLPRGAGYSFPQNGIVIEGQVVTPLPIEARERQARETIVVERAQNEIVDCKPLNDVEFSCTNRATKPGVYKYTIRVLRNGKPLKPVDPHIVNEN